MPKNKGKGGKNRRRGKNENEGLKRELVFKEDGQEYAQVKGVWFYGFLKFITSDFLYRRDESRHHERSLRPAGVREPGNPAPGAGSIRRLGRSERRTLVPPSRGTDPSPWGDTEI